MLNGLKCAVSGAWSKQEEARYYSKLGLDGMHDSVGKPLSDPEAGRLLMEIGAVLTLLPGPPARVLDWGCGTGWTSTYIAKRGYQVIGLDLSPEAVAMAAQSIEVENLEFRVHDFETPLDEREVDACVFFDSLHHSEDETKALRSAWLALRDGGIVIVCEPGKGHALSASSVEAVHKYGVRERDMSPNTVIKAARKAGFRNAKVLPHPHVLHRNLYLDPDQSTVRQRLLATRVGLSLRMLRALFLKHRYWGIVVIEK